MTEMIIEDPATSSRQVSNPRRGDVHAAIVGLLNSPGHSVSLIRSNGDWIRARWHYAWGIQLECSRNGQGYESLNLFPNFRTTVALFIHFARGRDGWHSMVRWRSLDSRFSLHLALRRLADHGWWYTIAFGAVALILMTVRKFEQEIADEWIEVVAAQPVALGTILLVLGAAWCINTAAEFVYRHDIKCTSDESPITRFYTGGMFFVAGLGILLSQL